MCCIVLYCICLYCAVLYVMLCTVLYCIGLYVSMYICMFVDVCLLTHVYMIHITFCLRRAMRFISSRARPRSRARVCVCVHFSLCRATVMSAFRSVSVSPCMAYINTCPHRTSRQAASQQGRRADRNATTKCKNAPRTLRIIAYCTLMYSTLARLMCRLGLGGLGTSCRSTGLGNS